MEEDVFLKKEKKKTPKKSPPPRHLDASIFGVKSKQPGNNLAVRRWYVVRRYATIRQRAVSANGLYGNALLG